MNLLYRIGATVLGLLAGGIVVALIEWLSGQIHPMPEGVALDDIEGMKRWVGSLPLSAFLLLLVAWGAGCFLGAYVARRFGPDRSALPAVVVCVLLTVATIGNLIVLPHPWWLWPTGLFVCIFFGLLGTLLAAPKQYLVTTTRLIDAPIEHVFQTLASIENFSKAVSGITHVEFLTEQQYGVGTRFRETRLMHGKETSTELEVTEMQENRKIRMLADAGGAIWDTVFFVSNQAGKVEMEMRMMAIPHALAAKLVTPMVLRMVADAVESDMDAVKQYCEI